MKKYFCLIMICLAFINFSCGSKTKPSASTDTTSNYTVYDTASTPVIADSLIKKEVSPEK